MHHRAAAPLETALSSGAPEPAPELAPVREPVLCCRRLQALRSPLCGLRATLGQLLLQLDEPQTLRLAHELEAAAAALHRLIDIRTSGAAPVPERFTLPELLSQAVAVYSAEARAKGVTIAWGVAPAAQGPLLGAPADLLHVLLLLLEHSVRHTRAGEIRLQAHRHHDASPAARANMMAICITDAAPALPEQLQRELDALLPGLEATVQLHPPVSALEVTESVRTLLLPLGIPQVTAQEPAPVAPAVPTPAIGPPRTTQPRRILLVDDYAPGRFSLAEVLRLAGHEVTAVASGEEALAQCACHSYDLILMDLQLPGMDGLETTRLLRQRERAAPRTPESPPRHTPVYAMTAYSSHISSFSEASDALKLDGFISKPVDLDALLRLLESSSSPGLNHTERTENS
ncbi:hypothetical protein JCM14635_24790 [Megalodesulfovibrio paquesii]